MKKEDVIKKIRRDLYGSYPTYESLREKLSAFLAVWKDELPEDFCSLPVICNQGVVDHWIVRTPGSEGRDLYTLIEDESISERREELVREGAYPEVLFLNKKIEKLKTEDISWLRQQLLNKEIENELLQNELKRLKEVKEVKKNVVEDAGLEQCFLGLDNFVQAMEEEIEQVTIFKNRFADCLAQREVYWHDLSWLQDFKQIIEDTQDLLSCDALDHSAELVIQLNKRIASLTFEKVHNSDKEIIPIKKVSSIAKQWNDLYALKNSFLTSPHFTQRTEISLHGPKSSSVIEK